MIPALLTLSRANAGWVLLAAVLSVGAAYYAGQYVGARDERIEADGERAAERAAQQAQLVDTLQVMAARAAQQAQEDFALAARNERAQREITKIFSDMQQEVADYVAANPALADCSLDAHGLRIWSAANAGDVPAAAAAAAEPHGGSPGASAAAVGDARRPAEQSRAGDGGAASMPARP